MNTQTTAASKIRLALAAAPLLAVLAAGLAAALAPVAAQAEENIPAHSLVRDGLLTRAAVMAEAAAARQAGRMMEGDASPVDGPAPAGTGLTRAQVRAELREARRLGLVAEGDAPAPQPTAAQLEMVRQAGLRAAAAQLAAK